MNRGDFQEIAEKRLIEARLLLDNEYYDGAYYLLGYVIECGFKAWISKKTREYDYPDKKIVDKIYTHNLSTLLGVIGAEIPSEIEVSWAIVKDWNEHARYKMGRLEVEASDMYDAVADPEEGVFPWIKQHW